MIKDIIIDFLPWIAYFLAIGPSQKQLELAIASAMIAFLLFGLKKLKKGFVLNWGTMVFFIFMFVAVVLFKNKWIGLHAWIFSNAALATIAWVSLFIGKPFTLQYARERVSAEKWEHPVFIRINQLLTMLWGTIFFFCMLLHIIRVYYPGAPHWIYEVLSEGSSILGIWITAWFPAWYRKKSSQKFNDQPSNEEK